MTNIITVQGTDMYLCNAVDIAIVDLYMHLMNMIYSDECEMTIIVF